MADQSQPSAFRALLGNRILQVLAVIAAAIAIVGEGAVVYTNIQKAQIELEGARNAKVLKSAEANLATEKAKVEQQAARNAEELKSAEAKLATQKAEIERQAANNAATLKLAEALQKQAEAAIAQANAGNAPRRSAAETREAEAKADIAEQDAAVMKFFADCQRRGMSRIDCGTSFIMEEARRSKACARSGQC
jgi:hypothetical protein